MFNNIEEREASVSLAFIIILVVFVVVFLLSDNTNYKEITPKKVFAAPNDSRKSNQELNPINVEGTVPDPRRPPSEIPSDVAFGAKNCKCPDKKTGRIQGAIDKGVRIGQIEFDGNDPYTFPDCQKDAQEVLNLLQNREMFTFARTLTREDIGSFPPEQMYFTWDRLAGYCKMYLSCPGVHACIDGNVVSGYLEPMK